MPEFDINKDQLVDIYYPEGAPLELLESILTTGGYIAYSNYGIIIFTADLRVNDEIPYDPKNVKVIKEY